MDEDVLHMIFQHLEGKDLLNCETVCRQWRAILHRGTPWKRFFYGKTESFPLWRRVQKKLESDLATLRTNQYRGVCKEILQAERNWHTGNFTTSAYLVNRGDFFTLTIGDDCVAWDYWPRRHDTFDGCAFLDMESMKITEIPVFDCWPKIVNGMLVRNNYKAARSTVDIWNPKMNWTINAEEDGFYVGQIFSGSGLILCVSGASCWRKRLQVWKMGNPPTLLRSRIFEDFKWTIFQMDQQFIVASQFYGEKCVTLCFVSTETLEVVTSLSAMYCKCRVAKGVTFFERKLIYSCPYDRGLLFQYRDNGIVRILDVASGTYVNDVRIPFRSQVDKYIKLLDTWACANSKVLVIGWKYSKNWMSRVSHLSVYDLEAVKKRNSDPRTHLLYTLQFQFDIHSFVMNECEIAFCGEEKSSKWYVAVLKFASFAERKSSDLEGNSECDEVSKEKIAEMNIQKLICGFVDFGDGDGEDGEDGEDEEEEEDGEDEEDDNY